MNPALLLAFLPEIQPEFEWELGESASGLAAAWDLPLFSCFPGAVNCCDPGKGDPDRFFRPLLDRLGTDGWDPWARVQEDLGRALGTLRPGLLVLPFSGQGPVLKRILAGIFGSYPEIPVLVLARGGQGQRVTFAHPFDETAFVPLEELDIPAPAESSGAARDLIPLKEHGESLGRVQLVWPKAFGQAEALARMLCRMERALAGEVAACLGICLLGPGSDLDDLARTLAPWFAQKREKTLWSLQVRAGEEIGEEVLANLFDHGLRLVEWLKGDEGAELPRGLMWKASKLGIWNHVKGEDLFRESDPDSVFIVNNPNMVHSFEHLGARRPGPRDRALAPEKLNTYRKVAPLPHFPIWQVLADARGILSGLCQFEAKDLQRFRVDPLTLNLKALGQDLDYQFLKPAAMDPRMLDEIVAMVDAGGSVDITHVRANLERAYLIGVAMEDGVIVGNSSLKHPRQAFIDRLTQISGLDFTHFVERGYTSVRPEYRAMGIGAKLLEGLTERATDVKVFSIIGEDNLATQKIAIRNRTRKIATYFSDKLGKEMGIWMPEHMIDSKEEKGS